MLTAATPSAPFFRQLRFDNSKPLIARTAVHCIRLEGHDNAETNEKMPQSAKAVQEKKQSEIWRLFKEAQQNILYLNRQRLVALEELEKEKREKDILLDKINELETKMPSRTEKARPDKFSISSDLLLRIDSMVLTGLIGIGEASEFRSIIMDSKLSLADDFPDVLHKRDAELLAGFRHFSGQVKRKSFHVLHICTEMEPVVSVGSLASYVTGLSRALQRKGHLVEVILPKYANLNLEEVQGFRETGAEFYSYFNGQLHPNRVWTGVVYGIGITFIEPIYYSSFFSHESIYGCSNDFERFTYFSRASLDYIVKSGKKPDVIHVHNWQTAIVGPLFWDVFVKLGLEGTRILLTCQGFESQCLEQPDKIALSGLDSSRLHRHDRLQDDTKTHLVNVLKGGIVYSNKVMVMSSTHSKGFIIRSLNHGLETTLSVHKDKLVVASPGFEKSNWDPSTDPLLPQTYNAEDMKGKSVCKVTLQKRLGLRETSSTVLVSCVFSYLADVNLENLKALVDTSSRKGVQFIIMGIRNISEIEREVESFQDELKDDNVRFLEEYDEALSHLILAGSDIILCQTFDDASLQLPLKAMRYAAFPVAAVLTNNQFRQIMDDDAESTKFSKYIRNTFGNISLSQAIEEIKKDRPRWDRKIMDAMTKDFSWDADCFDVHVAAYSSITSL